jgi:hypothetical protein
MKWQSASFRLTQLVLYVCGSVLGAVKSGLPVGAKIPNFALPDQNGKRQTFGSIAGPKGAMLVFFRSADW